MHYTGTIWRPPYEAASLLLEVTAGCTHHKCKFCTLYHDLPFKFRMSPLEDIECDLREVKRAMKGWNSGHTRRVFLTGANPFVLSYDKLAAIAELIHKYLPSVKSIGSFARITDVTPKTDEELTKLRAMGYDGLTSSPDRRVYPICGGRNGVLRRAFLRFFFLTVNLPDVPESWIIAAEQGFTKGVDCYDVI